MTPKNTQFNEDDPKADLLDDEDVNGDLRTNEIAERYKPKPSPQIDRTDLKSVIMECLEETGVVHESEIKGHDPVALSQENKEDITVILAELVGISKDLGFLAERTARTVKRVTGLERAGNHREDLIEAIEARDKVKEEAERVAENLKGTKRDKKWGIIFKIVPIIISIILAVLVLLKY
jgi:hypothetical protein